MTTPSYSRSLAIALLMSLESQSKLNRLNYLSGLNCSNRSIRSSGLKWLLHCRLRCLKLEILLYDLPSVSSRAGDHGVSRMSRDADLVESFNRRAIPG